ncbi:MAG: hypothetical protein ACYTGH_10795, partial [Planctomycetota bacterium]
MTAPSLAPADPFISLRLFSHHKNDELLNDLLAEIAKYPGCCDEVWFATDYGFPTMDIHLASAEGMVRSAEKIRAAGMVPSFQLSNSLGHGQVDCLSYAGAKWRMMVGHDGAESSYCGCPLSEDLHAYLDESTRAYARCMPGSVWIDDDLRMSNHGSVNYGCFCNHCMTLFSERQGRDWTREALSETLGSADGGEERMAWMAFNQERTATLAGVITDAVHAVSPGTFMALQHALADYNGVDHHAVFARLAGPEKDPVGSRPGGGFYNDHSPRGMLGKAYAMAGQIEELPEGISIIRPEVENFTHTAMGKTAHGTLVESALDIAVGCNGLSYATLMLEQETMAQYGLLLKRTAEWRPFLLDLAKACTGSLPGGLALLSSPEHARRTLREDENGWQGGTYSCGTTWYHSLTTMGLPLSMSRDGSCGTLLLAQAIDGFSDEELKAILSGGVIMDGSALDRLQERGLADWVGVTAERALSCDSFEHMSEDELNGPYKGARWIQWPFRGGLPVYRLTPTVEDARILGRYRLHDGSRETGIASVAVKNSLGGRTVVLGYNGLEPVVNSARRHQILNAANWIAEGSLPVLIETTAQVVPLPRINAEGQVQTVALLNATIDHTETLTVHIGNAAGRTVTWHTHEGRVVKLPVEDEAGRFTLTV